MTTPTTTPTANANGYHTNNNPTPHRLTEGANATPLEVIGSSATDKLVIVMVGLPATGKTHIAKRICRFITFFLDIPAQMFNVGDYRRKLCGAHMPASFYDHSNAEAVAQRTMACNAALADMIEFLTHEGVRVAVYDATNSTRDRRQHILKTLTAAGVGCKKMFIESICDDENLLEQNIRTVKLLTPDYRDMDPEQAVTDFKERRSNYEQVYEPLNEADGSHIKIVNCKKFIVYSIRGYLPLKVVHFVMNLHTRPRTFYFTRHGQSEYNLLGKIGGDSGLSKAGKEYSRRLADFAKNEIAVARVLDEETGELKKTDGERPCRLWTSTLVRTKETAQLIEHTKISHAWDNGDPVDWVQFRPMVKRNLDELYAGICDGMTYKEIETLFPEEFALRQEDKLTYRYPRGESYMDVTLRLEPLAHEMERTQEPVLVIGHQGILRILYAYFMGLSRAEAPYVSIPLNTVIQLTPHPYGCHESRVCLMKKEEMLDDGQDEPVTSMPVRPHNHQPHTYAATDPIMNAPSC